MLLAIDNYIRHEKMVSTQQLARFFQVELAALKPILECLERKGLIYASSPKRSCKRTCTQCSSDVEYYQCVDS